MCGIVGIIDPRKDTETLKSDIAAMASRVNHRGPDNFGSFVDTEAGVGLGHQRLSIQDLSELGNQPMVSGSGRYAIIFNGEIYNFKKIMAELNVANVCFRSASDTEVLLAAIEHWGINEAVIKCEGMFAFAIWDKREKRLDLCRDRVGEKPLYVGWHEGTFAFASELKSLHVLFPHKRNDICPHALGEYFRYGYVPAPYSINTGIFKLPQASIMSIAPHMHAIKPEKWEDAQAAGVKLDNYWPLAARAEEGSKNLISDPVQSVEQLDEMLRGIIRMQLIADVPVGSYLSGGIDSTLVSAIAQQECGLPLKTFTIGFGDKTFDEAPFAKKIARSLGTDHHEQYVNASDIIGLVGSIPNIFCEPHANPSLLPSILVARLAKKHVAVCLSGDGGDELFAGYNRYTKSVAVHDKLKRLPMAARSGLYHILNGLPIGYVDAAHRKLLGSSDLIKAEQSIGLKLQKFTDLLQIRELNEIYQHLVSTGIDLHRLCNFPLGSLMPYLPSNQNSLAFEERAMLADQQAYLPDDNLAKVDRASMSCSLETRLPLLNHRLIEFSWRIPLSQKIQHKKSKWLLRELLAKHVDQELWVRPKMGFSVPIASWLRTELREWMGDHLSADALSRHNLLNSSYISQLAAEHLSGKRDHAYKLWTVLTFQAWYDEQ